MKRECSPRRLGQEWLFWGLTIRHRILSCKSKTEAEAFSLQSLRKSRTTGGWIGQNHDIVSGGTKIIFVLVSKIEIFKDVVIFAV